VFIKTKIFQPILLNNTMEALMSGHPLDAKKVSITKASHLREWENTYFVCMGVEEKGVF